MTPRITSIYVLFRTLNFTKYYFVAYNKYKLSTNITKYNTIKLYLTIVR